MLCIQWTENGVKYIRTDVLQSYRCMEAECRYVVIINFSSMIVLKQLQLTCHHAERVKVLRVPRVIGLAIDLIAVGDYCTMGH